MDMKNDYLPGGIDDSTYVLPFSGGLTNAMAEARNPAGKLPYRFIKSEVVWYLDVNTSNNLFYMVEYNHMKVCACVLTCGLNGFDYAVLWKRY
jgi:hypothetical protein